MDVVSLCSMPAWGFVWQSYTGTYAQTVVVKSTFVLAPGTSTLATDQEGPNDDDSHWNDDKTQSIAAPSDKVPYKPRADVLLVGHAYAPNKQPTRSVVTRLRVGEVDKSLEVFCDRGFLVRDGQLRDGQRFVKMPLRWEKAAGGPDTNNPVGMRFDAAPDVRGMVSVPNLQPLGIVVSQRSDTFVPVCYAPIAPDWPSRMERITRLGGTFFYRGWENRPLPEKMDYTYFQSAATDQQQLSQLRADEQIILENLHSEYARLVTNLPNLRPKAVAVRATGEREDVKLVADTLWIDTDRGICVLVWRGGIGLRHAAEPGRIIVTIDDGTASVVEIAKANEEFVQPILPVSIPDGNASVEDLAGMTMIPAFDMSKAIANVMPFLGGVTPPAVAPAARVADGSLPFAGGSSNVPAPPPIVAPPVRMEPIAPAISSTPWAPGDAAPRPAAMSIGQMLAASANVEAPMRGPEKPALAGPILSTESPDKPTGIKGAAIGGALAASNAAAESEARAVAKSLMGRASIDLIWLNAGSMPRIRKQAAWKELSSGVKVRPEDEDLDDDLPPGRRLAPKDRREVLAILSRGEPLDVTGVEEALIRATEDENGFTPPLVLVAGELAMRFDELETLKATLAALVPHAPGDKRLDDAISRVQEMFKMPWAQGANAVLEETTANLRKLFVEGRKGAPVDVFDAQVEQTLLEHRHYRKRTVFGQPRVVGTLSTPGAKVGIPVYLPDSLAKELPGLRRMGVRMIGEVRPRAEQGEMSAVAMRVVAVGRCI